MNAAILVREAREAAGLTQADLAERVGVSQPEIARLEAPGANPRLETLNRVVAATGADLKLSLGEPHGIDPTLIAGALRSSPSERFRTLEEMQDFAESLRRARRRAVG